MITLFYFPSPNPLKVALFLEEAEVPYELVVVDTRKGDQHKPDFLRVNPNAKTPAIMDGDVRVFDSNAILLYLAEKYDQFLPPAVGAASNDAVQGLFAGTSSPADVAKLVQDSYAAELKK